MARLILIGGSYVARSIIANVQRCVNLYPEHNPKDAPVPVTLYQRPGFRPISTFAPEPREYNTKARVFTAEAFNAIYEAAEYPLTVNGVLFNAPADGIIFLNGSELEYQYTPSETPTLFIELIATDENLVPLPTEEQPLVWTVEATFATTQDSVSLAEFLAYAPTQLPAYAGGHLEWGE